MSARLKRNFNLLEVLTKAPFKQQKVILANGTDDLILCLAEIVQNLLKGNVKISQMQRRKLQKYKFLLRNIANKQTDIVTKKKLLTQKGGLLSALLQPAIGLIASLLENL